MIELLDSFLQLPENWNTYGAKPFETKLIDKAKQVLATLSIPPQIFPTGRNSIQFEYEQNSNYLEFEIYEDEIQQFSVVRGTSYSGVVSLEQVNGIVENFYA